MKLRVGASVPVTAIYSGDTTFATSTGTLTGGQTVTAKALTAQGTLAGGGKVYDGLATATPAGSAALQTPETYATGATSDGKPYTGDTVNLTGTAGYAFADRHVGTGKTVTESGLSLTGADLGNYTLTAPTLTANITAKALTVTATGPGKTYGTALSAGTSSTDFTHSGEISGEAVTSVTLTPNAAGLSATTAASGAYVVTPTLATGTGGFLAANYNITYAPYNGPVAVTANAFWATVPLYGAYVML